MLYDAFMAQIIYIDEKDRIWVCNPADFIRRTFPDNEIKYESRIEGDSVIMTITETKPDVIMRAKKRDTTTKETV